MATKFTRQSGGGMRFVGGGLVQDKKPRVKQETGEVLGYACNVAYMGGSQYVKLSASQFEAIKDGDFITFEATCRQYKDNTYPGEFTITSVNDKPIGGGA